MKKIIIRLLVAILIISAVAIPVYARTIENFDFSVVVYDWSSNNATGWVMKENESSAVINTLTVAGGYVTPSQHFNVRLRMLDYHGPNYLVGHKWYCAPNAREYVSYDYSNMTHWAVRAEFSLRVVGATAQIGGSWSPDTY